MASPETEKLIRLVRWILIGVVIVLIFPPVAEAVALLMMGLFSTD